MRSRVILQWVAGTVGGALAWLLTEPWPYLNSDTAANQAQTAARWLPIIIFGVLCGMAISACIAAAYGAGSPARMRRSALIGAAVGVVGGGLGLAVGQWIYDPLHAMAQSTGTQGVFSPFGMMLDILARSIGWSVVGFGFGVLQGLINDSRQRSINGAIGGAIGGFIGGAIFQLLVATIQVTTRDGRSPLFFLNGAVLRFISLTITGSFIGLFVGLAERMTRTAWVRVRVGRNEGAEFLLEKPQNTVGRDELSDIPLFGDMSVERRHAVIAGGGGAYTVEALAPGVSVNGQAVQKSPLVDGAVIAVGGREIEFHQSGAPRAVPQRDVAKAAAAPVPVPEGICPYCGERRDALGGCACSPSSLAPAPAPVGAPVMAATASASGSGPRLVGLDGPYAGQIFSLEKPETTVGREPDRDIPLVSDTMVSRRHAHFSRGAAGVEVADEGSSNGTFVNGARVSRQGLRPGDEVRIGASVFRVAVEP